MEDYVVWFKNLGIKDVDRVGGKNASLGEMISNLSQSGVRVPGGFATTATAYDDFLEQDNLKSRIDTLLADLDVDDLNALTHAGQTIRGWVETAKIPDTLAHSIRITSRINCS